MSNKEIIPRNFINLTQRYIDTHHMLDKGDRVLVCLSGGADSVCLLLALLELAGRLELTIFAAHVNHGLRGAESDADEAFVRDLCVRFGVELCVRRVNVARLAGERKVSVEAAAHDVRYDYFLELKRKLDLQKIATAHTASDNAETVLMNLMRGCGTEGMAGISRNKGGIVRPLLWAQRRDVEAFLCSVGETYVTDRTNLIPNCTRNKIRLALIPYLKEHFNPNIVSVLCADSALAVSDAAYLSAAAETVAADIICRADKSHVVLDGEKLACQPAAIATRLVRIAAHMAAGEQAARAGISNEAVMRAMNLLTAGNTGGSVPLGGGLIARRDYSNLSIGKSAASGNGALPITPVEIAVDGVTVVEQLGVTVSAQILSADAPEAQTAMAEKNRKDTECFDYNLIKGKIYIRNRTDGDVFSPFGMRAHKKISDLFIDEKIARNRRGDVPLLCDDTGGRILWVCGCRRSACAPVGTDTKEVLVVKVRPKPSFQGVSGCPYE